MRAPPGNILQKSGSPQVEGERDQGLLVLCSKGLSRGELLFGTNLSEPESPVRGKTGQIVHLMKAASELRVHLPRCVEVCDKLSETNCGTHCNAV